MADLAELKWYLSGGATGSGNTSTLQSTGGVITTTEVLSQTAAVASGSTAIGGITLGDAAGNAIGNGTLTYTVAGAVKTARWTPPSGTIGTAVDISASGTYRLSGGNSGGNLTITVVAASLPVASTSTTITIGYQDQKIFDDVTKAQSLAGLTEYRCLYLKNNGTVATTDDKVDIGIYLSQAATGSDVITLGLATQAPGTGTGVSGTDYPANTGSETTAPAGVTFSAPTVDAPLTAFTLSSTAGTTYTKALWIKREVPAGTDTETLNDNFVIGYKVKV